MILAAIIGYASDRIPLELTSVVIIAMLLVFFHFFPLYDSAGHNLLSREKILLGFSNPALLSVIALLVLGQAIVQTGALNEIANFILRISRNNAFFSIAITLVFVMIVSAMLNNTPVVVIFIPVMAILAKSMNISVSRVMIPLSFVSILGGMMTLIGSSTNLLVSGIMVEMGYKPLQFFSFTAFGMILATVGLFYVVFVIPRFLPDRASMARNFTGDDAGDRKFVTQIDVEYSSPLVGESLQSGHIVDSPKLVVRMVQRGEHAFLPPFESDMVIRPRDVLIVAAAKKDIAQFFAKNPDSIERHLVGSEVDDGEDGEPATDMTMAEIVVAPASKVVGKTLEQSGFRTQYSCVVLGVQRQSRTILAKVTEIRLAPGDVLLVMGSHEKVMALHESRDFLLMQWSTEEIHSGNKAGRAGVIFATVVGLAAFDVLPISVAAFAGVAAILVTGCLNVRQATRALDMKIVLLIAASLALGAALQETGGALYVAQSVLTVFDGASASVVLFALFALMVIATNILSNNAAAVLFTPIAINIAEQLSVNPMAFVFGVIFACNCSFATPIGYQTNLMVMGPGHYKFSDFIRSGIPLAFIIWLTYCTMAHYYFNLG